MSNTQNPHSLRIFTIISQIEQLLEAAPRPKLGASGRRLVDVDEIFDLLGDLKVTIPEDIRRANSVLIESDTLLDHANQDAIDMVEQAQREADALREQGALDLAQARQTATEEFEIRVSQDNVLVEVQRRCEMLQQHAEYNAQIVYNGAKEYADAILGDIQRYFMEYHQIVGKNREELGVAQSAQPQARAQSTASNAPRSHRPVEPSAPPSTERFTNEAQFEEEQPKRRFGWFRKNDIDEEYFDEAEGEYEPGAQQEFEEPQQRGFLRRKRQGADEELDIDLPE